MIKGLSHIAIVVPDLKEAAQKYQHLLGAELSEQMDLLEHGVSVIKAQLPGVLIELLFPLGEKSPISKFLEKNPHGGIHHFCLAVDHLKSYTDSLISKVKLLNEGVPKIGMDGNPVIFIHPKDFGGALIELEEVSE